MPLIDTISALSSRFPVKTSDINKRDWSSSLRSRSFWSRSRSDTDSSHSTWSTSTTSSSSPSDAPLAKVRVSDHELQVRARLAAASLDFDAITNVSLSKWVWQQSLREFSLYEAIGSSTSASGHHQQHGRVQAPPRTEVLLAGDINCSIEEVAAVLQSRSEAGVNATMKALHGRKFIYGALVHSVPLESSDTARLESSDKPSSSLMPNYVAVKTSTFVRQKLLARNDEWCFLESFDRSSNGDSLIVHQSTIDASELRTGRTTNPARVDELRGISAAFLVERVPRTRSVRLVFHGQFDHELTAVAGMATATATAMTQPSHQLHGSTAATAKAAVARLRALAKGASHIPEVVRRRRVGAQTLANRAALNATANTHCTCCTKNLRLALGRRRQRCQLCAYRVCDRCCALEQMETRSGHVVTVLLCTRCSECVDACEYADVSTRGGRSANRVEIDVDANAAPARADAFADVLATALSNAQDAVNRLAAARVIQHIVDSEHDNAVDKQEQQEQERYVAVTPQNDANTEIVEASSSSTTCDTDAELLAALTQRLLRMAASPPPLNACVLANATSRNYPIRLPSSPETTVPEYPMPCNEAARLRAIREHRLLELGEVPELNIVCELAAQELQCAISMVTVIDRDDELILSCNAAFLHRTRMARNETFCAHLIMDDKPLVVRHPEADVRFHAMNAVTAHAIRFYCGFPVTARDGTVVGSVCCLDTQARSLSQTQYATMQTLARTASKVLQSCRAEETSNL